MPSVQTDGETTNATSHRSPLGTWERAWQRPCRSLRGLVEGYVGYRQRLAMPASHRGLPSPTLPLVISFGPPQSIARPDGRDPPTTVESFLAGLHDRYVILDAVEHHGIQVDLRPPAAFRLLGRPLHDLTGQIVSLEDALGPDAHRLVDDLASAPDWPARFHLLDRFLAARLGSGGMPHPEVLRSWHRIVASRGRIRVGELAAEVGWSPRRLRARFGEQLGLSPKRMALLARFEHATNLLSRSGPDSLAEIAAVSGYYDQAHLTNDVRELSGLSPTALLASRLPDSGGVFDLDTRHLESTGRAADDHHDPGSSTSM